MTEDDVNESDYDSDRELQVAFKKGLLKGLAVETEEKEKTIYNKVGLEEALSQIKSNLPWIERMDLTVDPLPPPEVMLGQIGENPDDLEAPDAINNDFKRESKFYRLAQAAVRDGIERLRSMSVPTRRPPDYYAENAKSDKHMQRVREKIQSLMKSKEMSEKAKKMRELKKFGKQVQRDVLQKKQKEKRQTMDALKKFRKGQQNDFSDDKLDVVLGDVPAQGSRQKRQDGKKEFTPNKKRTLKDKKFGFGGQKKRSKHNTKTSTNDFFFNSEKGKAQSKGPSKGASGGKKKPGMKNRPGKQRRQNMRSKK